MHNSAAFQIVLRSVLHAWDAEQVEETKRAWDVSVTEWAALFAYNDAAKRADYELSERLGREWAAEMGLQLDFAEAA